MGLKLCSCMDSKKKSVVKPTKRQGLHELHMNYRITDKTTVLGKGSSGKVFLTFNLHNPTHWVAIKRMNKKKLGAEIEFIY